MVKVQESIGVVAQQQLVLVRSYQGVEGWLMTHLFRRAVKVEMMMGETLYMDTKSLVERLCQVKGAKVSAEKLRSVGKIHERVMVLLNPVKGRPIQYEQVTALFEKFRTEEMVEKIKAAQDRKTLEKVVIEGLDVLKQPNLTSVPYKVDELKEVLKPGDIFCRKYHEDNPNNIVTAQKVQRWFIRGLQDREGFRYSHVAMYLGEGKIAEAAWPSGKGDEIRILPLEDSRFALPEGSLNEYVVTRPKKWGRVASEIAAKIAHPVPPLESDEKQVTPIKYTTWEACRSIWHPANFGIFGRYRYIKQYIDDKKGKIPTDFITPKRFFCSYFLGTCLQIAEAREVMPKILGEKDAPPRGKTKFGTAIFKGLWARLRRWQHYAQIGKHVQLKFDAKRISPLNFRNLVIRNPDLFEDVYVIKSANG